MAGQPDDGARQTDGAAVNPTGIDAYAPAEIALRVQTAGVAKARQAPLQTLVLGVLAGVFIAFGGLLFLLVMTGSELGFGPTRWLGGLAFSLGLILVVVGGAELFTGNNLLVMAWAGRQVTTAALLRNWMLVYCANLAGALAMVALTGLAGTLALGEGGLGRTAVAVAEAKTALSFTEAFVRGILCNAL
ncbi:MAG: formate/nitrite transporter family protein, partial [Tistlia sp.]